MTTDLGPLVAALAKAQTQFAPVTKDKTVTVQTKTGGSYKFSYAPLDTILAAVRGPLSENGLVLVQTLDEGALVTSLLHESGGSIGGRMDLPTTHDIQGLGSAITYLRRYAIQALLGIAAEDDDDGNHAADNTTGGDGKVPEKRPLKTVKPHDPDKSLIGKAEVGKADSGVDFELHEGELSFRLTQGNTGYKVVTFGPLAEQVAENRDALLGERVKVWGTMESEAFSQPHKPTVWYSVVHATRLDCGDLSLPQPVEADSIPLFDPEESARIDAEEAAMASL